MGGEAPAFGISGRVSNADRDGLDFLAGGGRMEQRIRAHDWSRTPLGPLAKWPQSLKTALKIALNSRYPIWMGWGWDLINLYNDPYIPVLGKRDEWGLGASAREVWKEIWEDHLGPQADAVLLRGEASWNDQRQLVMYRNGYPEETYFTFSFSPLPADEGGIGGLFCACTEDTQKVLGERRLAALRLLAAETADSRTETEASQVAARVLSGCGGDVAFALIYLTEEEGATARLASASVPDAAGEPWAPTRIALAAHSPAGSAWPLTRCLTEGPQLVRDLRAIAGLPGGAWPEPASLAAVMPLARAGHDETRGFLVVGASPRLPFDSNYESFFELLARGVADALSNARAYEEEKRRAEMLAELDRAKTAFFSNVSHEFRTPLTLMLGPVQEALAEAGLSSRLRAQLEIAHRNGLRLQKLVNSLLDFARIEAGRAEASFEPLDLAALTVELASNFRSAMERAGLRFEVSCESLEEAWFVDPDMWEKIVLNLLSNAFKYTLAGGVEVRLRREGGAACLVVKDTGVGIPRAELSRLFERFHRVEATHGRTHEGSGIGLALVKELVRLHGGDIEVTSELGKGSTFTVRIPAGKSHLPPERIREPRSLLESSMSAESFVQEALRWLPGVGEDLDDPGPSRTTVADRRFAATFGARIVLADDNADMRSYVERLLKPLYRVETAADGQAALDAIGRERPALVVSDVMMPRLDGFALLKALRDHPTLRSVPVILLSARAGEDARIEGLDAGADDYLVKPFTARELLARVGALIELTQVRGAHEERMKLAIEGAQMATWDWDLATNALHWSPSHFKLLGYAPTPDGSADYAMWAARLHADDRQRVEESFANARHTRSEYRCEYRILRADDGATRRLAAYGRFLGEKDEANRSVGVMFDVTERHVAEESLREADRRKNEFLAMLAHELRNPLAPIANAIEILRRVPPEEPRAKSVLDMTRRQVSLLARLVDDLLDVSRVTQGQITLDRRPVELPGLIAEAVDAVQPLLREKQHRVSVQVLPPLRVNADSTRLLQCVVNVLTNAAKYTEAGGDIHIQTRAEQDHAVIAVTDTGLGISPELLPRIFDLFVQGHRTLDRSLGGLGVGLAIVKRLMQMHEGTVRAYSMGVGRGSTFELRLPLTGDMPVAIPDRLIRARPAPRRVLIVDDNRDAADALKMMLELEGHEVHAFYSARQTIEKAPVLRPDIVLVDIGLPELDGYEVARRLRAHDSLIRTRLIAITGYGQPEDRRRAHEAGFESHLVKPVELSALEPLLRA